MAVRPFSEGEGRASCDARRSRHKSQPLSRPFISFSSQWKFYLRRIFKMSSSGYSNAPAHQRASSADRQSLVPYSFRNSVTSPEQLHYSLGKTIGSGTYAKVKAAWSPYERKMVSPSHFSCTRVCTMPSI